MAAEAARAIEIAVGVTVTGTAVASTATSGADGPDAKEDYTNPLEGSSRWLLSVRAGVIRAAAGLAFGLMKMSASSPSRSVWLDSTLGRCRGKQKIRVDIWEPARKWSSCPKHAKLPAVINFHGGGFILGSGTDDAFWAGAVVKQLGAVVFSVNYRLAPEYPFPIAVEDCADAMLQISRRADSFGIDPDRIVASGFSAGGTLSLASWALLQTPEKWGYELPESRPAIKGLALFYPALDFTISRPSKRLTCAKPDLTLPPNLTDLFDACYIYPPLPRSARDDCRLSPGLMPDEVLRRLPPVHLVSCEHDMLLSEDHRFVERLQALGKEAKARVVPGESHAWDKPPPLWLKKSVYVEYDEVITCIRRWLNLDPNGLAS